MPDTPTTSTTTTSVIVPQPVVTPPRFYNEWGVAELIFGAVIICIAISNQVIGTIKTISDWLRERKKDTQDKDAPLVEEIEELKRGMNNFRSSDYLDREFNRLENKFDHDKAQWRQITEGLDNKIRNVAADVSEEKRHRTKLEAQIESVVGNGTRIEQAVERLAERMDERLDRFQELLINKK